MATIRTDHPMGAARFVRRERYVWPGGYALALVFTDGQLACAGCVAENFHLISQDTRDKINTGWRAAGLTHAGEADSEEYCACCGEPIFGID